eukprot:c4967_g1_i1.p1 GENE.c4967_g1_i1~~c4967_g1_i1.p1  ORF type:complete len:545 (+),score=115.48 c4967_g1_i1:1-1635(+)
MRRLASRMKLVKHGMLSNPEKWYAEAQMLSAYLKEFLNKTQDWPLFEPEEFYHFISYIVNYADMCRLQEHHDEAQHVFQHITPIFEKQHENFAAVTEFNVAKAKLYLEKRDIAGCCLASMIAIAASVKCSQKIILKAKAQLLLAYLLSSVFVTRTMLLEGWEQLQNQENAGRASPARAHREVIFQDSSPAFAMLKYASIDLLQMTLDEMTREEEMGGSTLSKPQPPPPNADERTLIDFDEKMGNVLQWIATKVDVMMQSAQCYYKEQKLDIAVQLLMTCVDLCSRNDDRFGQGEALKLLGSMLQQPAKRIPVLQEARTCHTVVGAICSCGNINRMIGESYLQLVKEHFQGLLTALAQQDLQLSLEKVTLILEAFQAGEASFIEARNIFLQINRAHGEGAAVVLLADLWYWLGRSIEQHGPSVGFVFLRFFEEQGNDVEAMVREVIVDRRPVEVISATESIERIPLMAILNPIATRRKVAGLYITGRSRLEMHTKQGMRLRVKVNKSLLALINSQTPTENLGLDTLREQLEDETNHLERLITGLT